MIRGLKALWPFFVAISATSMLAASAASATEAAFELEAGTVEVTASSSILESGHLFQMAGQSFTCNNVGLVIDVPAEPGATSLETSSSTYNYGPFGLDRCVGPLGFQRKLTMNGCQYRFNIGERLKAGEAMGTVDIACPSSKEITTHGGAFCTIYIPPQSGLSQVIYRTNDEAGRARTVAIDLAVTNIKYRPTGLCGSGERDDGHYTGTLTVEAVGEVEAKDMIVN